MRVINIPVSTMYVNAYIYFDEHTKEAVIIDPGKDAEKIMEVIRKNSLNPTKILLTHGHFDHITAVNQLKQAFCIPVYAHKDEVEFLSDPMQNESATMGWRSVSVCVDHALDDGDEIEIGAGRLKVIHTPGHTMGGVSYYDEENRFLFSGDSLFYGSIGRTDFPYGDGELLIKSLKEKILILPDDVNVLPGHGRATTIGNERQSNPFLKG